VRTKAEAKVFELTPLSRMMWPLLLLLVGKSETFGACYQGDRPGANATKAGGDDAPGIAWQNCEAQVLVDDSKTLCRISREQGALDAIHARCALYSQKSLDLSDYRYKLSECLCAQSKSDGERWSWLCTRDGCNHPGIIELCDKACPSPPFNATGSA